MDESEYHYAYSNDVEYRIFSRNCQFFRNISWEESDKDIADRITSVYREVELKYHVFINCNGNVRDFRNTLASISNQSLLPKKIVGVEYSGKGKNSFNIMKESSINTSWALEEFLEDVEDWRDNMILKYKKGAQLFVFIDAGVMLDLAYFERLSVKINHEDLRFSCITGDIFAVTYGTYFLIMKEDVVRNITDRIRDKNLILDYEETL